MKEEEDEEGEKKKKKKKKKKSALLRSFVSSLAHSLTPELVEKSMIRCLKIRLF